MSRSRNSIGRYAKTFKDEIHDEIQNRLNKDAEGFLYREFNLRMPGLSIVNIIKFIFFIILISPWIYVFVRNGSFSNFSEKIISFYDEKFTIHNLKVNATVQDIGMNNGFK
jgi:hypothetical protein